MKTAALLFLGLVAALDSDSAAAQRTRPDLNGHVFSEQSQPLKAASIFIYTAGPKVGVGTL